MIESKSNHFRQRLGQISFCSEEGGDLPIHLEAIQQVSMYTRIWLTRYDRGE